METKLIKVFKKNVENVLLQRTHVKLEILDEFYRDGNNTASYGISSIISFTGEVKGRLLLDMEPKLALHIAKSITGGKEELEEEKVLLNVAELSNEICRKVIEEANEKLQLNLKLAPPLVFVAERGIISIPKLTSMSCDCNSEYGKVKINIAFEGSE